MILIQSLVIPIQIYDLDPEAYYPDSSFKIPMPNHVIPIPNPVTDGSQV